MPKCSHFNHYLREYCDRPAITRYYPVHGQLLTRTRCQIHAEFSFETESEALAYLITNKMTYDEKMLM